MSGKENWKEMSREEKCQYFLEYYGGMMLGILLGVGILVFLIVHFATKTDMALGILAVNANGEDVIASGPEYFNEFLEEHGINSKRHQVNLNRTLYIKANSEDSIDQTNLEILQTLFLTQSVDVFLADEEFFLCMAQTGYLADLQECLSTEILEECGQNLIYVKTLEGETIAAGIRLAENPWIKATGWYQIPVVAGLADGMKDPELAAQMMQEILGR